MIYTVASGRSKIGNCECTSQVGSCEQAGRCRECEMRVAKRRSHGKVASGKKETAKKQSLQDDKLECISIGVYNL